MQKMLAAGKRSPSETAAASERSPAMRSFVFASRRRRRSLVVACAPKSTPAAVAGPPPPPRVRAAPPAPAPATPAPADRGAAPTPPPAAPPAAATASRPPRRDRAGCRGWTRRGWTWRTRQSAAAAADAAAGRDAGAGDADRVGDGAEPRSAGRPGARPLGRGAGRVEHAARLDDAAVAEVPRRHQLRPRVHRQVHDSGQLQRLPDLRHLESREADARC